MMSFVNVMMLKETLDSDVGGRIITYNNHYNNAHWCSVCVGANGNKTCSDVMRQDGVCVTRCSVTTWSVTRFSVTGGCVTRCSVTGLFVTRCSVTGWCDTMVCDRMVCDKMQCHMMQCDSKQHLPLL